jgi:hypothetical protein
MHGRERELKAGLRDEVFLMGREAIINACRHSRATHIEVEVGYWPTELHIVVRATTDAASIPTHCGGEGMNTKVSGGCGSGLRRLAHD